LASRSAVIDECLEAVLEPYTHNSDGEDYEQRCIVGFRHDVIKEIEKLKWK